MSFDLAWTVPPAGDEVAGIHAILAPGKPMSQEDDAELVYRCKQHDDNAFGELFNRHKQQVFGFVSRKLGPDLVSEAADIVMVAFAQAWRKIDTFRCDGSFVGWVKVIACNLCIDFRRKKYRQPTTSIEDLEGLLKLKDPTPYGDVEGTCITKETQERLRAAMSRLKTKERNIMLRFVEGFKDSQIAAELRMTVHQVNGIKWRATSELKDLFS